MMSKRWIPLLLVFAMTASALAGCRGDQPEDQAAVQQRMEDASVVIAMDPNSEPAAGFDPAYGWGAGEHVHEPLIQSTLTVTNTDLTIGYDLATDYKSVTTRCLLTGSRSLRKMWHLHITR